jgi:hypothetical protein
MLAPTEGEEALEDPQEPDAVDLRAELLADLAPQRIRAPLAPLNPAARRPEKGSPEDEVLEVVDEDAVAPAEDGQRHGNDRPAALHSCASRFTRGSPRVTELSSFAPVTRYRTIASGATAVTRSTRIPRQR